MNTYRRAVFSKTHFDGDSLLAVVVVGITKLHYNFVMDTMHDKVYILNTRIYYYKLVMTQCME